MPNDEGMSPVERSDPPGAVATPRGRSSEPPMPPRQSMAGDDSSPTRKRPRLDGAGRTVRSMSADLSRTVSAVAQRDGAERVPLNEDGSASRIQEEQTIVRPTSQSHPSQVTLNLRTPQAQPHDGQTSSPSDAAPSPSVHDPPSHPADPVQDADAMVTSQDSGPPDKFHPPDSPVSLGDDVQIELVDQEDDMQDPLGIHIDGDDTDFVERFMMTFPFSDRYGVEQAAGLFATHVEKERPIVQRLIAELRDWIITQQDIFKDRPSEWPQLYHERASFWDAVGLVFHKLAQRRQSFGEDVDARDTPDGLVLSLFGSYAGLVARLVQVDVASLQRLPAEPSIRPHLLSAKHFRVLHFILAITEAPIWHMMRRIYHADVERLYVSIARTFANKPTDGIRHLADLCNLLLKRLTVNGEVAPVLISALHLLLCCSHPITTTMRNNPDSVAGWASIPAAILGVFDAIDEELPTLVEKQLPSMTVDFVKDMIAASSQLLQQEFFMKPNSADDLLFRIVGPVDGVADMEPDYRVHLLVHAWKFKVMKKCIMKGRMETRVSCVGTMSDDLVATWKMFHGQEDGMSHAVMQYFATFLLDEHIIDYIVGVDSHPQLISRSGNIAGFLVVTDRYTSEQTDTLWNAVSGSQDPRAVSAMLQMLHTITNLVGLNELLYFCDKLQKLRLEAFTAEMRRFVQDVIGKIQQKSSRDDDVAMGKPVQLCIRLIQEALPTAHRNALHFAIVQESSRQLEILSHWTTLEFRRAFYVACSEQIESKTILAAGSASAIYLMAVSSRHNGRGQTADDGDVFFLAEDLELTIHVADEFCHFVAAEKKAASAVSPRPPTINHAFEARSSLFFHLMGTQEQSLTAELEDIFWDHFVGPNAIDNTFRDQAWLKLAEFTKQRSPPHDFLDRCLLDHIPKLEARFYTLALGQFLDRAIDYQLRKPEDASSARANMSDVPISDLLWHIVLNGPTDQLWTSVATLLSTLHFDSQRLSNFTPSDFETVQAAVIGRCIQQLESTYSTLTSEAPSTDTDSMDVSQVDRDVSTAEREFVRTLHFLTILLGDARAHPEFFVVSPKESPSVISLDSDSTHGDSVKIRYQTFGDRSSDIRSLEIGDLETLAELHARLLYVSKFKRIMTICAGQRVDLLSQQTIRDSGISTRGHILVRKVPGEELSSRRGSHVGRSFLEQRLINHFDVLYGFLDMEDKYSAPVFEVLSRFPPHESVRQVVSSDMVSPDEIFPPGKTYKIRYSVLSLTARLRDMEASAVQAQVHSDFVAHGVRLLATAITRDDIWTSPDDSAQTLSLAAMLLECLLTFLKERPGDDSSTVYFSDEEKLVDRLFSILRESLSGHGDPRLSACAHATLLESCLHSRAVWDKFREREDLEDLYKRLLLSDERRELRQKIAQDIEMAITVNLTSSCVSSHELASLYWQVVSQIIHPSVDYPSHSASLFRLAEIIFRRADEINGNEETLRSCLVSWSSLLLRYRHDEFVGRDEMDETVFGLAKLSKTCVQFLKSFKKALNTGSFMDDIFRTFLFPPLSEGRLSDLALPILESQTRKELYDLVLILCEDLHSWTRLIDLIDLFLIDEQPVRTFAYDRNREIRAESGYVGLSNLSNTCYMNSLLTQLFMNVDFREFILSEDVQDPEGSQKLLAEFQRLFAYMQESYNKFANTDRFAVSIQTPDNQGIDVTIQMDVDEFFNLLFDQCESQIFSSEAKRLFRSFYGGQTVNQIKSKECHHVSEREETFFAIQCDVKGKTNLYDSLQSFVEGDVMEGDNKYKCESCGGRFVDAVKRTCLKEVPDNLIFHLKRFDFDLVTMQRSKINDYFEFPYQIDVSPYKVDHLDDPEKPMTEDIFDLVGILVHAGTAESGHYYSFMRSRQSPSKAPTWVEFNDIEVNELDYSKISDHCFGGPADPHEFEHYQTVPINKSHNAYMLFYQRQSTLNSHSGSAVSLSGLLTPPKVAIPPYLKDDIARDNERRIREYCLFDPHHPAFVRSVMYHLRSLSNDMCSEDHKLETRGIRITMEYIHQVITRTRDSSELDTTINLLRRMTNACLECAKIALTHCVRDLAVLRNLLIRTPQSAVRTEVGAFIVEMLQRLRDQDPLTYGIDVTESESNGRAILDSHGVLPLTCTQLAELISNVGINFRAWDDFFQVLVNLAGIGAHERAVLLQSAALQQCFYILHLPAAQNKDHLSAEQVSYTRLLEKRKPSHQKLLELVWLLLSMCDLRCVPLDEDVEAMERLDGSVTFALKSMPLTHIEYEYLHLWDSRDVCYAVLGRALDVWDTSRSPVPMDEFIPGTIILFILAAEPEFGSYEKLAHMIKDGIEMLTSPFVEAYIQAATYFCMSCFSAKDATILLDSVARATTAAENHAGLAQLNFIKGLIRTQNPRIHASEDAYYSAVLRSLTTWAPHLLVYHHESAVRAGTAEELRWLLFRWHPVQQALDSTRANTAGQSDGVPGNEDVDADADSDPDAEESASATAMTTSRGTLDWVPNALDKQRHAVCIDLFSACIARTQMVWRHQYTRRFLQPMLEVLGECNTWVRTVSETVQQEEAKMEELDWTRDRDCGVLALGTTANDCNALVARYYHLLTSIENWTAQEDEQAVSEGWSEYQTDSDEIAEN